MINYLDNIKRVFFGTALAQLITIAAIPVLSRLYTVEEFGILGIYVACANIGRVVYSLRYDFAIQSSANNDDAKSAFWLSISIGFSFTILSMLVLAFFGDKLPRDLAVIWFLIPVMVYASSVDSVLGMWANRNKQYQLFAKSRVLRALLTVIFQLLFFFVLNDGVGLLAGLFIAECLTIMLVVVFLMHNKLNPTLATFAELLSIAKKNKNNPRYLLPGQGLNIGVAQLPIFIVSSIYGKEAAGYIYMAQRIVSMPGQLISDAIFKVFFTAASELFAKTNSCYDITIKTIRTASVPLFLLFFFLSIGAIFTTELVLGTAWEKSKYIIAIYALSEIVPALFHPISAIWVITANQRLNLKYQIIRATIVITTLLIAMSFESLIHFVAAYGLARTLSYFLFLSKCLKLSRG